MRRNELRTAKGYIEALSLAMEDCHWSIEGVVTPAISEDGKTAYYMKKEKKWTDSGRETKESPSRRFSRDNMEPGNFDHCFGWQECHFEDSYGGQVMFPLDGKEYLLVGFNC